MADLPKLFIFSGVSEPTGAFIAAYREAVLLQDLADVTLVVAEGAAIDRTQFAAVKFLELPLARTTRRLSSVLAYPFALLRSGWSLRRALRKAGCERLQVNDFYSLEGAVTRLLGFTGTIVTWVRMDPAMLGAFGRISLRLSAAASDAMVAVSHHIAGLLNGNVDAETLYDPAPAMNPRSLRDRSSHFLFPGNFNENKGQDVAIRAFALIAHEFPAAELHFYGSDLGLPRNTRYLDALKSAAKEIEGAERIHFHAFRSDIAAILDCGMAVLNLSKSESFSLVCQEACAAGLPVIATRSGGPAEIVVDGVTGILVPVDDVEAIAAAMRSLLLDPARARAMGSAGALLMQERFSSRDFRNRLSDCFRLG